jgi:hypothetical protein
MHRGSNCASIIRAGTLLLLSNRCRHHRRVFLATPPWRHLFCPSSNSLSPSHGNCVFDCCRLLAMDGVTRGCAAFVNPVCLRSNHLAARSRSMNSRSSDNDRFAFSLSFARSQSNRRLIPVSAASVRRVHVTLCSSGGHQSGSWHHHRGYQHRVRHVGV